VRPRQRLEQQLGAAWAGLLGPQADGRDGRVGRRVAALPTREARSTPAPGARSRRAPPRPCRLGRAGSPRSPRWEPAPVSRERFRALLPGVVAFGVDVRSVKAMFKLSQGIDAERYARVRADLAARNPRLADLMGAS
jgi:hypothetical protein